MRLSSTAKCLAAAMAIQFGSVAPAATLIVSGGELVGASGVDVNGTLYDVTFVDGTCVELFSGCDAITDFAFNTILEVGFAEDALLDQVFIDGPLGLFDSIPSLTSGCEGAGEFGCEIWIPDSFHSSGDVQFLGPINVPAVAPEGAVGGHVPVSLDTTLHSDVVWARFVPSAIPEPGTWLYMLLGFGVAGAALRRSRRSSTFEQTEEFLAST